MAACFMSRFTWHIGQATTTQLAPCAAALLKNLVRELQHRLFVGHRHARPATLGLVVPLDRLRRPTRRSSVSIELGCSQSSKLQRLRRPRQQAAVVAGRPEIVQRPDRRSLDLLQPDLLQDLDQVEHLRARRDTSSSTISDICLRSAASRRPARARPSSVPSSTSGRAPAVPAARRARPMARFRAGRATASLWFRRMGGRGAAADPIVQFAQFAPPARPGTPAPTTRNRSTIRARHSRDSSRFPR